MWNRCSRLTTTQNPRKLESVRNNSWWRTHNKLCSPMIFLRYQGGNTRRQIKVEVGPGYCSTEDKCLNLHRKWYLKESMVGTTIAKSQIPDIKWTYTKGIINLREALMIRSTSCTWAWTQSSRSTPTYSMHNLSFTTLDKKWFQCQNLPSELPEEYDPWKLLGSHRLRKA